MRRDEAWQLEERSMVLPRSETAEALADRFGWKPGIFASLLVKALSVVLAPLDRGTYRGRPLSGDPHLPCPTVNTPFTVFIIPDGRWQRFFLAARLRSKGFLNIIQDSSTEVRPATYGVQGRRLGSLRLESLVAIQRASDESLTLVPVTHAFHQHHPEAPPSTFFTRLYMLTPMHVIRRIGSYARTIRTARLWNCRPIDVAGWLKRNPRTGPFSQATDLHNEVIGRIRSEFRAVAGPPIPQPWQVRKSVLRDPILLEFIREYAAGEGRSRRKLLGEARANVREIASKIRVGVFRGAGVILNIGFDRLLTGFEVDREGLRSVVESDSRSRAILVCCHKSYMDPLILTYGVCRSGLTAPQQAAGINLNIWPLGWILRRCGGFYLRRSFVDQPVYRETFNAYIRRLLADNYIMAFYIEGARSRDGKLRKPKTGFMKILNDAMRYGACDGITLFPVYLGYDRVPEEAAHVKEMAGGHKIAETMGLFKRLYKSATDTLGRAYIKFGTPIDFADVVKEYGLKTAADLVCDGIDAATVVTARSLASWALLAPGSPAVSGEEYERAAEEILQVCSELRLPLADDADVHGMRAAVDWLASEGHVEIEQAEDGERIFRAESDQRRFLEFNKNILLAHLLAPSLAALAERHKGPAGEATLFLERLFREEFVFAPGFHDRVKLTASGVEMLKPILHSFLEGYLVVCNTVRSVFPGEGLSRERLVERCFERGSRMLDAGMIKRPESLSRIVFENALELFRGMDLLAGTAAKEKGGDKETMLCSGDLLAGIDELEEGIRSFLD